MTSSVLYSRSHEVRCGPTGSYGVISHTAVRYDMTKCNDSGAADRLTEVSTEYNKTNTKLKTYFKRIITQLSTILRC